MITGPINDVTSRHHFARGMADTNFNTMPYLEVEILEVSVHLPPSSPNTLTIVEKLCTLEGIITV